MEQEVLPCTADILSRMQQLYGLEEDKAVASWEMLLHDGEKLADAVIVATQDKVGRVEISEKESNMTK